MINRVTVRNFQSLREVDLALGRFTVIVGASNSGKTAFLRALRAVASNIRGTDAITRGATSMSVTVRTDEHEITLQRSATAGCYRLTHLATGVEQVYTKLGGAVPDAITRALGIDPVGAGGHSLNFAQQHDPPFLLADSGAAVARVLGELTNVDVIFAAVREANRRRAEAAGRLRTRQADLAEFRTRARTFATLPARLAACSRAESAAQAAAALTDRLTRLRAATTTLEVAEMVLARARVPQVPDDTAVAAATTRLTGFKQTVTRWLAANQSAAHATQQVTRFSTEEARLHTGLHDALVAAGTCPTCGQSVT